MRNSLKIILLFTLSIPIVAFSQTERATADYLMASKAQMKHNPKKAFALLEQALLQAQKNHEDDLYLESLNALNTLVDKGYPESQEKVFAWSKQAVRKYNFNSLAMAQLYYAAARSYFKLTPESDSAILFFQKALKIRLTTLGQNTESVAECYHGLGDIYAYRIYNYLEAEKCYEQALRIREEIGTRDLFLLASNYYNLAITNHSQLDFVKALSYGISAVQIATKIDNPVFLEQCYAVVASIYHDTQQHDQARTYYHKAIELNRTKSKSTLLLAWHYEGLAETFRNESNWEKAIESFNTALLLFQKAEKAGLLTSVNSQLFLYCQLTLAQTYRQQEQYEQSRQMLNMYFATLHRFNVDTGRLITEAYSERGKYFLATKNYDSSFYYFNRAITSAINGFNPQKITDNPRLDEIKQNYFVHSILRDKASALTEQYHSQHNELYLTESIKCLQLAEKLLTLERNSLDVEESKQQYSDENYSIYEQALENLYQKQGTDNSDSLKSLVFYFFESSKAQTLSDAIRHAEQTAGFSSIDAIVSKLNTLQRSWFVLEHQLSEEQQKQNPKDEIITSLHQQQVVLDRRIQKLKAQIEFQFPGYSRIKFQSETVPLQKVKSFSREKNRSILEFFYGAESIYAIGITDNDIQFKRIGSRDSIELIASQFLKHFSVDHSSLDPQVFQNFISNSKELHRLLIQPFKDLFSNARVIQVVPDGILNQIPFELLITESPTNQSVNYKTLQYAIRQYSFGYAYSSSLLVGDPRPNKNNPTLLAMGLTGGSTFRSSKIPLAEIRGVELELEVLRKQFESGKFLSGHEVTELNFKQLAPDFDIIHLAVHGQGNMSDRFSSSLFFLSDKDSIEDGQLHAYELYGIKFMAKLAVLTACESGLGKMYKGEGMMSIAAALTYSGCENTLMSLWKVNDNASIGLTQAFYNHLQEGHSINQALTLAKLNYLEQADEFTADPAIWAPMIAYGDLNAVFKKEKSKTIYILLGIIVVLLLAIPIIRSKLIRFD